MIYQMKTVQTKQMLKLNYDEQNCHHNNESQYTAAKTASYLCVNKQA
jgi:hypothetical protein